MDVPLFRLGRPGRPVLLLSVFRHDISFANVVSLSFSYRFLVNQTSFRFCYVCFLLLVS